MKKVSRRSFVKSSTILSSAAVVPTWSAKSYKRIIGSNERLNVAVAGIRSRGTAHIIAAQQLSDHMNVMALCDVDNRLFARVQNDLGLSISSNNLYKDVRKLLEDDDIDVVTIATPDHWHAPMAIMAMQAGKDVYLEKPFSHNPQEGEWVIKVQRDTGRVLQIGNQQRSAPTSREVIKDIHDGIIGEAYYSKAWYSNNRGSIGQGKQVAVPEWLDWDLWQGPAPRRPYMDNYVHYNWHWFWHWGTGEINNNGLHELDIARWALQTDLPSRVTSAGGRYHFKDDWEFYDTQVAAYEFEDGKSIHWEGRSCARYPEVRGHGRGNVIYGTEGSVFVDRNGYQVFDNDNNVIKEATEEGKSATTDTKGVGGLDVYHMKNFLDGIRLGTPLHSVAEEAHVSTLLCHLGNMAQEHGGALDIDTTTGRPYHKAAMEMWSREYEPGWDPKV